MTEGQGELPFDPEMQTRNEQEQVRASLERLGERLGGVAGQRSCRRG